MSGPRHYHGGAAPGQERHDTLNLERRGFPPRTPPYGATKRPRLANRRNKVGASGCSPSSLRGMPDALRVLILTAAGWVNRHQEDVIDYLREENRPPGATWPTSTSPDRRPAPSTRGARPETRPADAGAGRRHRHA